MGLGDFLQNIFGSKNTFSAQPMALDKTDYNKGLEESQRAAIGSLNAGADTGKMQVDLARQLMEQSQTAPQIPSVAEMQLQKAADQNIKNQAALIASRKGMNPAAVARSVAMMGASTGQDLANQAAQLRSNEQLQALQMQLQKQGLLNQALQGQRGLDITQQGQNVNTLGTFGQLNQAQQNAQLQNYWNAQNINAQVAAGNASGANNLMGGLMGAGASILAGPAGAALFGGGGGGGGSGGMPSVPSSSSFSMPTAETQGRRYGLFAEGGVIGDDEVTPADYNGSPEMRRVAVSPGEKVVNPEGDVMTVPGKANHRGDDPRNDTVIADLRRDSVVIPRSKSGDKEKMIEFLKHVKESSKKKSDLQQLLESHNDIKQKLDELQYKMGKWTPK
jgi:hypothetical protein